MKIKAGFVKKTLAGQTVVVAFGEAGRTFHGMIKLNDTGAFIWDLLASGMGDEESIVARMAEEYEVELDVLRRDVSAVLSKLLEAGVLE